MASTHFSDAEVSTFYMGDWERASGHSQGEVKQKLSESQWQGTPPLPPTSHFKSQFGGLNVKLK